MNLRHVCVKLIASISSIPLSATRRHQKAQCHLKLTKVEYNRFYHVDQSRHVTSVYFVYVSIQPLKGPTIGSVRVFSSQPQFRLRKKSSREDFRKAELVTRDI